MVYADYTASGRCLTLVERYLQNLQRIYANSHTEDDISGRSMTHLLEEAEAAIKRSVHAGPKGRIVPVGSGRLPSTIPDYCVMLPPATRLSLSTRRSAFGQHARKLRGSCTHQPVVSALRAPFQRNILGGLQPCRSAAQ
jgi:hypothetical protein